jgi:putative transposase
MTRCSPFRDARASPEVIRLTVMLYVRCPLSLRNVEDLRHERGLKLNHETVRFWRQRFAPILWAEIRKRRANWLRTSHSRWHLDEVFVRINGVQHYP